MPPDDTEAFQHYRVLRRDDGSLWKLGVGAMGVTYKAIDTNLDAPVALKVINALYTGSDSARERFIREAKAAASLRHRNVASVYHLGRDAQSFFYAMEFIDGETVEHLVAREGPQSWRVALPAALQVARALMAAHEKRLVHRDVKPANVMLVREVGEDDLTVKLIDFGLAKTLVEEGGSVVNVTGTGFLGTPLFASPEQCEEIAPDIRSDIYSLGVTLWFVLAGRAPFQGGLGKVFAQHLHAPPPWDQLPASVPEPVRALLARMLAKDRADRPQTPADLRRDLEACLRASGQGIPTLPGSEAPPLRPAVPAPPLTPPVAETLLEIPPDAAPPSPDAEPSAAGFSLGDALRQHEGRLPAALVADLLRPLAQIVDAAGPAALDVTPGGVRVVTGQTNPPPRGVPFTDPWLTGGEPGWLDIRPVSAVRRPLPSANETMPPRSAAFTAPAAALAALAYELIGGRPPTAGQDYRPLAECGETGNRHLRHALTLGGFTDAGAFADAFARSLDQRGGTEIPADPPTPPRSAPAATAPPTSTPPKKKRGCAVQLTVAFVAVVAVVLGVTSLLSPSSRRPVATGAPITAPMATPPPTPPAPASPPPTVEQTVAPASTPPVEKTAAPMPTPADVPLPFNFYSHSSTPTPPPSPDPRLEEAARLASALDAAHKAFMAAEFRQAIAAYTQVLALAPDSLEACDERASAYYHSGDREKANADYRRATQLQPKEAREHYYLADAYESLDERDKAGPHYADAVTMTPGNDYEFLVRGRAYDGQREHELAIADYTEAIRLNPQATFAFKNRADACYEARRSDQAIADYTEVIRLNPQDADAFFSRGYTYLSYRHYAQAIADYTEAIHINPQDAAFFTNRATALRALGRTKEAAKDEAAAKKLNGH